MLIGTVVVHLFGVPASWLICRRPGAPVRRHLLAGFVVGALVAILLTLVVGDPAAWPVFAAIAIGVGMPLAAAAAWAGLHLPDAWVKPVAITALLLFVVALLAVTVAAVGSGAAGSELPTHG